MKRGSPSTIVILFHALIFFFVFLLLLSIMHLNTKGDKIFMMSQRLTKNRMLPMLATRLYDLNPSWNQYPLKNL
jgi:uncharacterized membrane protein